MEPIPTQQPGLPRLLTAQELADYLNVPVKTIYRWRYAGMAPTAIRAGGKLRFRVQDIEAWMEKRTS